ncbi:MAG TPA: cytochrome C, partial [Verrucomicrobiae bacterium]|nr:cytochrome C [Verrucomicrobiae bacterium]
SWDDVMPKCATCHAEPHGKAVTDCGTCHTNPHTPKKVAMDAPLVKLCTQCHAGPKEQLTTFPSKHSKVDCQRCHTSHGYKPTCFQCHKPHHQGQELATCLRCHPVHRPLQITYDENTPAQTCGSCHTAVYDKWQKTKSKHGKVNCATCHHSKHKVVPKCTECHGSPHKKEIHSRFPNCLSCHIDVHDLPSR